MPKRKYYLEEKYRNKRRELQRCYRKQWVKYFNKIYKPLCQICERKLDFKFSHCFDHKNGHKWPRNPHKFTWSCPCTKKNKKLWKSFNFGLLCRNCNVFLPTDKKKREIKINNLIKYSLKT